MTGLLKRESRSPERVDVFDRFDRMFDDWMKVLPFRGASAAGGAFPTDEMIRVDEFRENGSLVVRAELPGIDPDKDVELTVSGGMLCIEAERREEEKSEEKGYLRHELRVGSFSRVLPLPKDVSEADIEATYKDGILEIRVPAPEPAPAAKIPIAKT
ncbi:MAG: Hsp20/alpha crystallin family protein [Microthrixaceae bacterium]